MRLRSCEFGFFTDENHEGCEATELREYVDRGVFVLVRFLSPYSDSTDLFLQLSGSTDFVIHFFFGGSTPLHPEQTRNISQYKHTATTFLFRTAFARC